MAYENVPKPVHLQQDQVLLTIVAVLSLVCAIPVVGFRLYVRARGSGLGGDDWLIMITLVGLFSRNDFVQRTSYTNIDIYSLEVLLCQDWYFGEFKMDLANIHLNLQ